MSNKAKTRNVQVKGVVEWAKVFEQNRDMTGWNNSYVPTDGACTVDMLLDDENLQLLRDAGSGKELNDPKRKSKDGYRLKFVRKFKNDAYPSLGGAPAVAKEDGTPWDISEDGLIGNGSTAIAYLSVYDTNSGNSGTRLDGLQILDLVEFEGDGDYSSGPNFKDYSGGTPSGKSAGTDQVLDDEVPF